MLPSEPFRLLGICFRSAKQRDGVPFLSFAGCLSELPPYSWGVLRTTRQFVGQLFSTPQFAYLLYKKLDNVSLSRRLIAKRQFDGSPGSRCSFLSRLPGAYFRSFLHLNFVHTRTLLLQFIQTVLKRHAMSFSHTIDGVVKHDGIFIQALTLS